MKRRRPGGVSAEPLEVRRLMATGELIRNGSFEGTPISTPDVPAAWEASGAFQADSRFSTFKSGLGYAYLADPNGNSANSISGQLYQRVTIPADATELKLSFWTRITTAESASAGANDVMNVRVLDATGTSVLAQVATLSNRDASTSYVQRSYTLPLSLAGQTVRIAFDASTNASAATTFRIDDVGLSSRPLDTTKRVVGYLPYYQQGAFSKIDLNLVTHINYFSVSINANGTLSTGSVSNTNLATVVNAAHAKGVGVSIVVTWGANQTEFATVAADPVLRETFATNIVKYCTDRNLDGIDIDWEPPGTAAENATYGLMIDALYAKAAPVGLKLTAAMHPYTKQLPLAAVNQMDWLNVMTYDFKLPDHSTFGDATGAMNGWSTYGVPKSKLLMGVPFYGRNSTGWGAASTYSSIVGTYDTTPDPDADVLGGWNFNGVTTIERKAAWVRDNGYGGMMVWELGQDRWGAGNKYDQYSLTPIMKGMMQPPAWLAAGAGSRYDLFGGTSLILAAGPVTFAADAAGLNPNLNVTANWTATSQGIANPATSIVLGASQTLASLALNSASLTFGATAGLTLTVNSLTITGTGKLDLGDNTLVIRQTGAAARAAVEAMLVGAYGAGKWNGTTGLVSSTAAADASRATGLAYYDDGAKITVRRTFYGDANANGTVSADDVSIMLLAQSQSRTDWQAGDFNFDNRISSDDWSLFAWGATKGAPAQSGGAAAAMAFADGEAIGRVADEVLA